MERFMSATRIIVDSVTRLGTRSVDAEHCIDAVLIASTIHRGNGRQIREHQYERPTNQPTNNVAKKHHQQEMERYCTGFR
jgi:hypothetical protein